MQDNNFNTSVSDTEAQMLDSATPGGIAADLAEWVRLLLPLLGLAVGAVYFFDAVLASILSTPHPALVYAIFAVCAVAVLAVIWTQVAYQREGRLARWWLMLHPNERSRAMSMLRVSSFRPLYHLLQVPILKNVGNRQQAIAAELEAGEILLDKRLELPNFLGGALVGLGLVGTFVGLLGTLEDLSKVFNALTQSSSSALSPTEMFADMVSRLQAPMRGMGTAFVASLYGLLGSLVVSLTVVSARKSAARAVEQLHNLVRYSGYGAIGQDLAQKGEQPQEQLFPDPLPVLLPQLAQLRQEQSHILRWLGGLQQAVQDLSNLVAEHQSLQAQQSRQSAQILSEILRASQGVVRSQQRGEEALLGQLSSLQTISRQSAEAQSQRHEVETGYAERLLETLERQRLAYEQSERQTRMLFNSLIPDKPSVST